jgi:dipeptidyl aminopeptidase/acylaminoacyl peptidase
VDGLPVGWSEGMAQAPGLVAVGLSDAEGFAVYVAVDGAPARRIATSQESLWLAGAEKQAADVAAFSGDGSLLALQHAEHGVLTHPSLRIVDPRTGTVVAERGDGSSAVEGCAWSPQGRLLAVSHEPADRSAAAVWDLADDAWTDLDLGVPGDVRPLDWWPDGSALLVHHLLDGRSELYRFDLGSGEAARLGTPPGSIDDARVRPDGRVWFQHTDGVHRVRILDDAGGIVLEPPDPAPPGRPFRDWRYRNDAGQTVHGWIVEPEGEGPHPVMIYVHGGPHWLYEDRYMAEVQAYVDLGFLVGMPNYRGSTGYGRAWRDALTGDVGFTDVDDVSAGLRDLLRRPDADPSRTVIAGWSWGGYITTMQMGRNPDLWTAGMAGVPVGDLVMAYRDESPALQAMDRTLMGGTPEEVPDVFRRGNPITYVDEVRAPMMLVIGEHDARCPPAQAFAYADRLAARGVDHEVYRYATGHGALETEEDVRQLRAILAFLRAKVPGLRAI